MKSLVSVAVGVLCTTAALPAFAALRQVYGTVSFQDAMPGGALSATRPARSVEVHLKVGGDTIGTAHTNSSGVYSVWVDDGDLPVGGTLRMEYQSKNFVGHVKLDLDWFDDSLTWDQERSIPSGTTPIQFDDTVTIAEFSQHFSILDAMQYGREYANARREGSDDIGYINAEYPDADWTHYDSYWGDITIAGPAAHGYGGNSTDHGWSDGVILHEYGHHLEYDISDNDSGGGTHNSCTDNGYGFAWSEGWATFFASAVSSVYPANLVGGFSSLESTPGCSSPSTEAFTQSVLWDLHDGVGFGSDAHDRVNGAAFSGPKMIKDIMFGIVDTEQDDVYCYWVGGSYFCNDPTTSIVSFHNHWVNRNLYSGAHADLDRVYAAHGIFPHALSDYSVSNITRSPSGNVVTGSNMTLNITLANGGGVAYADEPLQVRITVWPSGSPEIQLASFTTATFTGTKNVSRTVTMPSSLAQTTQFVFVYVDQVDRFPESVENNNVLAIAVPVVKCGNGTCSSGETCTNCPSDCGSCCGNGMCTGSETCQSCASDCGSCGGCGDGWCIGSENQFNCNEDCGVEGGSCFVAGTPISMADGTTKPIEEIAAGDRVLSYDTERGALVEGSVVRTFVHSDAGELVVINGDLVTTSMHRFWADGRWVAAEDLDAGSTLLALSGADDPATLSTRTGAVRQIESRDGKTTTYNFEVAGWHDYFAGGVLVHNIKKDDP